MKNNDNLIRGIIYIDDTHYECGNIEKRYDNIQIYDTSNSSLLYAPYSLRTSPYLTFSYARGTYMFISQAPDRETKIKSQHVYPYCIERYYAASNNLKLFQKSLTDALKSQKINSQTFTQFCPFTFGIEYETSIGVIPQEECFINGLIPVRDGSITGNEYTTTVLAGDKGIHLINKQMQILNTHTDFNRDCSIHIHFGNFPLDPKAILTLNNVCAYMTNDLQSLLPRFAFTTSRYKANQKDYCKSLQWYSTFEELYQTLTGMKFFGDLHQPHPNDPEKRAKWNVHARYHMCNFINLLCYDSAKTVEFRFLKPTKNVHIIYFWLYVLNALMLFAIKNANLSTDQLYQKLTFWDLRDIITNIYPQEIAKDLIKAMTQLSYIRSNQLNNGDFCGEQIHFENDFKLSTNLIQL